MGTFACKIFPNENAARGAINSARAGWTPPVLINVGAGVHAPHRAPQDHALAEPIELESRQWAVIADHPGFQSDIVTTADFKQVVLPGAQAAQSDIVARPGAQKAKDG